MGLRVSVANNYSKPTSCGYFAAGGMFPTTNTSHPIAVAQAVEEVQQRLFPDHPTTVLHRLFADVQAMFEGRYLDYLPIDLRYHDFQHTLQATLCLAELLDGRHAAGAEPALSAREFECALAAVVLHDTGYLKLRGDTTGTGAKYTYTHVLRSCAVAASHLPSIGFGRDELNVVLNAIGCTGPVSNLYPIAFGSPSEKIIGCCVATADFLGQMAAPDYPDELGILFAEFEESDDYLRVPRSARAFKSPDDLIAHTPEFWAKHVLPKLETPFMGVYRYLSHPFPNGTNRYLEAIEHNISRIQLLKRP